MTTVLVVDDQELVRSGFRAILDSAEDLRVVGEAADGIDAVAEADRLRPDVVLMDIRMPRLDGIEATARIVEHLGPTTRVLVLTTFGTEDHVLDALRAGASGFLLKDATSDELVRAVRTVAAGDALLAPAVTRHLVDRLAEPRRLPPGPEYRSLTDREVEVLGLLGRGCSNAEVAEALTISETTAKTHVASILSKLGVRDRVHAVIYVYEHGLDRPDRS
ncbi:response regulator [Dermatobacter hominis]|uniref:response regulator n=1 Tax=Dermatobacter hominis TaxID=2884263 RepID=UPI001D105235|nr:response regulator transcription factor [Dermatobacter hominis]UDY34266.1 response regulator transcription factor [Dermatobacter hominis]